MELIGSWRIRAAACVVLVAMGGGVLLREELEKLPGALTAVLGVAGALLLFMSIIMSFAGVYERWMAFANVLHKIVVTILFGGFYLIVVPLFYPIVFVLDPLRLRQHSSQESFWVRRRRSKFDLESARRMG